MKLTVNKTNVLPVSSDYPFGDIKNDDGTFNGTPLDRELLSDYVQFFEKLFDESTFTTNNLPDNATNGFQLYNAFNQILNNRADEAEQNAIDYFNSIFGMNVYNSFSSIQSEFDFPTVGFNSWNIERSGYELNFVNNLLNTTIVSFGTDFVKGVISNIQFLQNPAGSRSFDIIINSTNAGSAPIIKKQGVSGSNIVFSIPIGETFQILRRETDWLILP